jgi:hypothetical protein
MRYARVSCATGRRMIPWKNAPGAFGSVTVSAWVSESGVGENFETGSAIHRTEAWNANPAPVRTVFLGGMVR